MQKIKIIVVGNIKEKYFMDAICEYQKRLSRFASVCVVEVEEVLPSSKTSIEKIKEAECAKLEKQLEGYVIALDKGGELLTSEDFAGVIDKSFMAGNGKISFVIGGSYGLTNEFLSKVNKTVSFGKITYPHQLIRVLLFEQIYRAETILNHITYHK